MSTTALQETRSEGKLGKEIAMLRGHVVPQHRAAEAVHLFPIETYAGLQGALARMPGPRSHRPIGEAIHRERPVAVWEGYR